MFKMFPNQRVIGRSWSAARHAGCVPASLAALALWLVPVLAEPPAPVAAKIKESVTTFKSGGQAIHVRHFEPAVADKCPAIVLLHGTDGPGSDKDLLYCAARRFAARGYHVLFVHYFDRTGGGKTPGRCSRSAWRARRPRSRGLLPGIASGRGGPPSATP